MGCGHYPLLHVWAVDQAHGGMHEIVGRGGGTRALPPIKYMGGARSLPPIKYRGGARALPQIKYMGGAADEPLLHCAPKHMGGRTRLLVGMTC